jgi:predicted dehydrogenase
MLSKERAATADKLRLVLVGAGQIGVQAHLPAVLACPQVELAAVIDSDPERAAPRLARYGVSVPVFRDLDSAIAQAQAAVIATPGPTHFALSRQCLTAGLHVLIEKPVTETTGDALELLRLAQAHRVAAMVGYVTRFRANVRLLRSLLHERYFGRVHKFSYQFGTRGGWAPVSGYGTGRMAGVLAITGSHFLDRMLWFWGYPSEVSYRDDGEAGPASNCVATVHYPDGLQGVIRLSKTVSLPGALVLVTDAGHVLLRDNDEADIELYPAARPQLRHILQRDARADQSIVSDVFVAQLQDFIRACGTGGAVGCDLAQSVESIRLMEDMFSVREPLPTRWYDECRGMETS